MSKRSLILLAGVAAGALVAFAAMADRHQNQPANATADAGIERGRYLARTAGCNDCHTPGYALSGGKVPEDQWLTGDTVGFRGPWGTTYPVNLRLYFAKMTENQWVARAQSLETRPPMPWFAIRDMTEGDQRAIYRYVRSLGAPGMAEPDYVPPTQEPKTPFIVFVPQMPK